MKVKTRTGIVSGKTLENGVEAFLGIPYAKQPVGDLRWRAPERLDDSDEEIECVDSGILPGNLSMKLNSLRFMSKGRIA